MTCLKTTPSASSALPALLALLHSLTAQIPLGRDTAAGGPNAADIEYFSWMSDPGAVEFDSWAAYLRHSVR